MFVLSKKFKILYDYFRANGGIPHGEIAIDDNQLPLSNVTVNESFYGVFDFETRRFTELTGA